MTKIVELKPIKRNKGNWVVEATGNPEHEAAFMLGSSEISLTTPMNRQGVVVCPATDSELKEIRSLYKDLPASDFHNNGAFWRRKNVIIRKSGRTLDIGKPEDLIEYVILRACNGAGQLIAPSWEQRNDYPTYRFALVEKDSIQKIANSSIEKKADVFAWYKEHKTNSIALFDLLNIYYLTKGKIERPSISDDLDSLVTKVTKLIETRTDDVYEVISDKDYENKVLINRALEARMIVRKKVGSKMVYYTDEDDKLGSTLRVVSEWIQNPDNEDFLARLTATIEAKKDK